MFVNSCVICCFGIVGNIVLFVCFPGAKHYSLFGCLLSGFDIQCIVAVEIGGVRLSFDDSFASRIFFWRSSPKSKVVGGLPASHKECRSFWKLFLIVSLLILFMEKFTCPSSIIDSMAKDRRSFVLTT